MLKVLFYHANDTLTLSASDKSLFLGISALYLKTYLDTKYETFADQIEWLLPLQHKLDDNDLLEIIYQHKPDLFCTSHYIWNSSFLFSQLERIQNKIPRKCRPQSSR